MTPAPVGAYDEVFWKSSEAKVGVASFAASQSASVSTRNVALEQKMLRLAVALL